ncbi:hypothetical protein QBC43DRAFT_318697 [Cladorrhinum sp. PSN259]|nr:hypothetical protein QBC43DRAFT_318697 [Cladorrhinum sp. PSN259]
MSPSTLLTLLALSTPLVSAQSSILTFFLPDSEPVSLDASIISIARATPTTPGAVTPPPVTHLQLACPTASSPDNDACRAASIYPAQVYHTQGSVWGGTTTHAGATTSWECALGDQPGSGGQAYTAECKRQIISGTSTAAKETFGLGNCYVLAHRLPIVVTAGQDQLEGPEITEGADAINSYESSEISAAGCPTTTRSIWEKDVTTTDGPFTLTTTPPTGTPTGTGEVEKSALKTSRGVLADDPLGAGAVKNGGLVWGGVMAVALAGVFVVW